MPNLRPAARPEWPAAASLAAAHLPRRLAPARADHVVRLLLAGEVDPRGMLVAEVAGRLVGALLAQVTPGGVGSLLPPAGPHAPALVAEALDWFRAEGVRSAQCLVDRRETPDPSALEVNGFTSPADLLTLTLPATAPRPVPPGPLQLVPFNRSDRAEVARVAEACFDGSPDFPELNAQRPVSEWLAGHGPAFEAGGWLALLDGAAVGLGIATPASGREAAELHYLGLVPAARGRGLGHALLARLLATVAGAVVTSVDARNLAARRVYARAGFRESAARAVYLWAGS